MFFLRVRVVLLEILPRRRNIREEATSVPSSSPTIPYSQLCWGLVQHSRRDRALSWTQTTDTKAHTAFPFSFLTLHLKIVLFSPLVSSKKEPWLWCRHNSRWQGSKSRQAPLMHMWTADTAVSNSYPDSLLLRMWAKFSFSFQKEHLAG